MSERLIVQFSQEQAGGNHKKRSTKGRGLACLHFHGINQPAHE